MPFQLVAATNGQVSCRMYWPNRPAGLSFRAIGWLRCHVTTRPFVPRS